MDTSGYACPIMKKKYPVILTDAERDHLKRLIAAGTAPARKLTHARILLKADQSAGARLGRRADRRGGGGEPADRRPGAQAVRRGGLGGGPQPPTAEPGVPAQAGRGAGGAADRAGLQRAAGGAGPLELRLLADKLVELEIVEAISPTRPCGGRSKKRTQAAPEEAVVHPAQGQRRVRLAHGGRAGGLHPPLRSARPLVCMDETTKQLLGDARPAAADGAGKEPAGGLRVRAGGVATCSCSRAACGLALGGRDRAAHQGGLGAPDQGAGRRALPRGRADRAGAGQPEHPHAGLAVRGVPAGGGQTPCREAGDPLHAQARQLAEHGRDRAERAQPPVPGPARARRRDARGGGRSLAGPAQRRRAAVDWRFTTEDARIKLKRLYPSLQE